MGTPAFAVPSLEALAREGYEIVGVFTQPDRPAGRGHKLAACPVKQCAEKLGLKVYQFEKLRTPEGLEVLRSVGADLFITAAFGQILTQQMLDIPPKGVINVHASLLPKHRGSAPINRCIMEGDEESGVTIMLTDKGIDTGDMLSAEATPIGENETAGELTDRLSLLGAELLVRTIPGYLSGEILPKKQDPEKATYEPMLDKAMAELDWTRPAIELKRLVMGFNPWPCAYTSLPGGKLKVLRAAVSAVSSDAAPGTVVVSGAKEGLVVACGEGCLELTEIQAPNSKAMGAKAYLMGKKIPVGTVLGGTEA